MNYLKKILLTACILLICPALAWADTLLHDEPAGTVITFSDREWVVLEQMSNGSTYVLLNSNDGNRSFDPDNTQIFDPNDSNNIGHYLNNTFYNNLSQKELILSHSWDIRDHNGGIKGGKGSVNAKVGLISYHEYKRYGSYYDGNILPISYDYYWWTLTPNAFHSSSAWHVNPSGFLVNNYTNLSRGVRPALYLKSGIMISDSKVVIGDGGDVTPPSVPTSLKGNSNGPTEIKLTWNANTEDDLAGYKVYRDGAVVKQVSTNSYTDSGLNPETEYEYQVTAYNNAGLESGKSNMVKVTTEEQVEEDTTPPAIPTGLAGSAIDFNEIKLTWDENTDDDFFCYVIYRNGVKIASTLDTFYSDKNLKSNTEYKYSVSAKDQSDNESDKSEQITVKTPKIPIQLNAPKNLQVINVTDVSAVIKWGSVRNAEEYVIQVDGVEIGTTTETSYNMELTPNTHYTVTVKAVAEDQESSDSDELIFTTLQPPASTPGVPDLQVKGSALSNSVILNWNYDDPTISKWEVYVDGQLAGEYDGSVKSTTIKGLDSGAHNFKVRAINSKGEGQYSEPVEVEISSATVNQLAGDIADIFVMMGMLIKATWTFWAFVIALIVTPKVIHTVRTAIRR